MWTCKMLTNSKMTVAQKNPYNWHTSVSRDQSQWSNIPVLNIYNAADIYGFHSHEHTHAHTCSCRYSQGDWEVLIFSS